MTKVFFPASKDALTDAEMLTVLRAWIDRAGLSEELVKSLPDAVREKFVALGGLNEAKT